MGVSTKIIFGFITVIVVTVLTFFAYGLYTEYQVGHAQARDHLNSAIDKLKDSFRQAANYNVELASKLLVNPSFMVSYQSKDRSGVANEMQSFIARNSFSGFVTVIDDNGHIFYSTETPNVTGISLRNRNAGVDFVLSKGQNWIGPIAMGATDSISLAGMVPMPSLQGIVVCGQPLNSDYLTGLAAELAARDENFSGAELALYSTAESKIIATSAGLLRGKSPTIMQLSKTPFGEFEADGRLWEPYVLTPNPQKPTDALGVLLVSKPVPDLLARAKDLAIQDGIAAAAAVIFALIVAAIVSGQINYSLKFLSQRARDFAAQKSAVEPLDSLKGEFLELGELMDTAVSSLRTSVTGLKTQMLKQATDEKEKTEMAQSTSTQLDAVNRQLSSQTKQLTDLSRQLNSANQKIVEQDQSIHAVMQVSPDGILFLDQAGTILSANHIFLNWLGSTEGEIAGRHCFDLVKRPGEPKDTPPINPGQVDIQKQFFADGLVYHHLQEKAQTVHASLQPVKADDGSVRGYIMILRDSALTKEIDQLRQDIVHILSDSVRTPLSQAEAAWDSILQEASQNKVSPTVGQALAQLHNHYAQMSGVADSLLMMYGVQIQSMQKAHEPVVVTRLLADCMQVVAPQAEERKLQLDYKTVTGLPNANVDRETMKKVLVELLSRMISLTAPGGKVRVENKLKDRDIRISISSSGPPMSQEELQDMFVGFIAGKHAEETYSSRLAMYLARNAVERMGGRIWAAPDEEGKAVINCTMSV